MYELVHEVQVELIGKHGSSKMGVIKELSLPNSTQHETEEYDNDDGADKEKVEELLEEGDSRKIGKMDLVTRWKDLYEEERHDLEMVKQNRYTQLGKYTERERTKMEGDGGREEKTHQTPCSMYFSSVNS